MFQKIYEDAFKDELEKIALSTEGVEDRLGAILTPEQLIQAEELIARAKEKSFILRHPWLTGFGTLGIAPAIANENAYNKISRTMIRTNPDIKEIQKNIVAKEHELDLAAEKNPFGPRTAASLGSTALLAASILGNRR